VLAAQRNDSPKAATALEALCHAYWQPLYAYARRRGQTPHDAEDLTQEFFARLLEKNYLRSAHRDRGHFRQFLLMAFKRFLANEWDRTQRLKRGGGKTLIPIDARLAERLYREDEPQTTSAELAFERRWALSLLERALSRLRFEFEASRKASEFAVLKSALGVERGTMAYADFARALGINESAARVAVHRLRKRFRQIFREEVAATIGAESGVDDEVRHLITVLGG
jgi:RNA polymerase sigma-70 factor (ECF subfamily)